MIEIRERYYGGEYSTQLSSRYRIDTRTLMHQGLFESWWHTGDRFYINFYFNNQIEGEEIIYIG